MAEFGTLDFAVSFSPTTAFPLDSRYYFESLEDANSAASKAVPAGSSDGKYFFGENVVVVADGKATMYIIQPDKTLSEVGEGSGDPLDYTALTNKPSIEGVELNGDITLDDLGIKQTYTASDITFSDGDTFQQKYDAGELTGESGVFYGSEEPDDPDIKVWIDPDGSSSPPIPNPTISDAKKSIVVNDTGDGFEFGTSAAGGELLLAEYVHQGNQEIHFTSFDWETGIGECTEPHGLTEPTKVMIVINDWKNVDLTIEMLKFPVEWGLYNKQLYVVPQTETSVKLTQEDKSTSIPVDSGSDMNKNLDLNAFHLECPVPFLIEGFPNGIQNVRVEVCGFFMGHGSYRYIFVDVYNDKGKVIQGMYTPNLLSIPMVQTSKVRQCILGYESISVELFDNFWLYCVGFNKFFARLETNNSYAGSTVHEEYHGVYKNKPNAVNGSAVSISGIGCKQSTYSVYSNGTVVRAYAKGVKQG